MGTISSDGPDGTSRVSALIDALSSTGTERSFATGDVLCRQHDESDEAYVVIDGAIAAQVVGHAGPMTVATHGPGSIVGEVTTLIGGHRTAALIAAEESTVAVVNQDDLHRVFADHPDAASKILQAARERTDRSRVAALLSEELQAPDGAVVAAIADRVTWTSIVAGDTLFERGDLADAAYLVVSGRLGVTDLGTSRSEPPPSPIEVGRGGIVGEFGLLEDRVRGATVVALRDTTLARLSAADFAALTHDHTALAMGLVRRVLERSGTETVASTKKRSFVLAVTTSVTDAERSEIVEAMVDALDRCGPTSHLSHSSIDRILRQDGISDTPHGGFGEVRLAELLHQAETESDHLLLDTGPGLRRGEAHHWVDRVLHHADLVVVICSPDPDDPETAAIHSVLDATPRGIPRWLALLHPASTVRPSRGMAMRTGFGVDEVHHLRGRSRPDLGRLARLAAGSGVGLVLSGGGARGHAHLGVYAVLSELGIPVDRVVGASMGSIVAGGIGQQLDPDEALRTMRENAEHLLDYTIPFVSLVKGERIVEALDRQFDGWDLDDMWVPFTCVSTDLTSADVVVHRDGPAARAIRTSVAIPGVLPPVAHDGHLLADGGVLDNLPAGHFGRDPSVGVIIASDVAPPVGPSAQRDHGLSVSGWKVARQRIVPKPLQRAIRRVRPGDRDQPGHGTYPGLGTTLLRSLLIGSSRSRDEHLAAGIIDLYLELDLRDIPLLDFGLVEPAAAAGREQAQGLVSGWLADRDGSPWGRSRQRAPLDEAADEVEKEG
jgi:predicted acylesterase/phospholipase RssA/CRP-like cAMP-binding protein